ncbi:hypothetical protein J4Q44_G00174570 [Coregonus suidteri]|uniref:Uncharacterized protein n=1 Tax=Coregonus suidteri TaxID=861788 RepID=A0AAN8QUZ4_9TELE
MQLRWTGWSFRICGLASTLKYSWFRKATSTEDMMQDYTEDQICQCRSNHDGDHFLVTGVEMRQVQMQCCR